MVEAAASFLEAQLDQLQLLQEPHLELRQGQLQDRLHHSNSQWLKEAQAQASVVCSPLVWPLEPDRLLVTWLFKVLWEAEALAMVIKFKATVNKPQFSNSNTLSLNSSNMPKNSKTHALTTT